MSCQQLGSETDPGPPITLIEETHSLNPFHRAVVYAPRSSPLLSAMTYYEPRFEHHSMAELLTLNTNLHLPNKDSIWLDIPDFKKREYNKPIGRADVSSMCRAICSLIHGCIKYKTPLCWIRGPTHRCKALLNELANAANVRWTTVCSCQFSDGLLKKYHLKRQLFILFHAL